jgi:hypothetical protein
MNEGKMPLKESKGPLVYEEELRDLAYELGGVNATVMNYACYIGMKLFNLDIPDDFEPYGKLFVMSDFMGAQILWLEQRIEVNTTNPEPPETREENYSTLRKLGLILKHYEKDDIRLAAVYLMRGHKEDNFSQEETERAEAILSELRERGEEYFPLQAKYFPIQAMKDL